MHSHPQQSEPCVKEEKALELIRKRLVTANDVLDVHTDRLDNFSVRLVGHCSTAGSESIPPALSEECGIVAMLESATDAIFRKLDRLQDLIDRVNSAA